MALYSYFILIDTNDPTCFTIECTAMRDWRLRLSAIKSNHYRKYGRHAPLNVHTSTTYVCTDYKIKDYVRHLHPGSYNSILCKNYCHYLITKKEFESLDGALEYRDKLVEEHRLKTVNNRDVNKLVMEFHS